jgi:uncharacterized protein (DUF58 family)
MSWRRTTALVRVSVLPAAIAVLAVLARRADLLMLAAPLALAAAPLVRRPLGQPRVVLSLPHRTVNEDSRVRATLSISETSGVQTLGYVLATPDWVAPPDGGRVAVVLRADGGERIGVGLSLSARRWGYSAVGPGMAAVSACGGLLRADLAVAETRVRVLPISARYKGTETLPHARGVVGLHRSTRAGDGSELIGIRRFAPGDRIRRINWRTSLRSNELHVDATATDRDAAIHILLDARFDAGTSGGVAGQSSGIDRAVRATAALSAFYLGLGDRVGLVTYAGQARVLAARAGRVQWERILTALLETSAPRAAGAEPALPIPPNLDPRSLVLLVSPLVGRHVFTQAAVLARSGHSVVVVDTLTDEALPTNSDPWTAPVNDLWRQERAVRVRQLTDLGMPIAEWQGNGSLDAVLRELSRAASRSGARR